MSGLDWDDLRVFLAVERSGSVRAAARQLGLAQSTVSRRLDGLETRLGARLFLRGGRGLTLTETGLAIRAGAEQAERTMLQIERDALGRDAGLEGDVVISLPPPMLTDLLMPDLARFQADHPGIRLEFRSTYAVEDLTRREADIAVRFAARPDDHLLGRRLPEFHVAAYATPDYLARHRLTGPDATGRWIGWMDARRMRRWISTSPFPDCALGWTTGDIAAQMAAAEAGLGLIQIACVFGDRNPRLVRVPPGRATETHTAWVLTHADLRSTERVRVTLRFLADRLTDLALAAGESLA